MDDGLILLGGMVVSFVGGIGVVLGFIKKYITDPQLERADKDYRQQMLSNELQAEGNLAILELSHKIDKQNKINEIENKQIKKDIILVDEKVDKHFIYLDGRIDKYVKSPSK